MRGITYKMQENAFGSLSKAIPRKLQTSVPDEAMPARNRRLRPSFKQRTRLVREWHGVTHTVVAHAEAVGTNAHRARDAGEIDPVYGRSRCACAHGKKHPYDG